jgi:F-type H+-transporting ATPase subunit epsilon
MAHTKFRVEVLTPEGEVFNDEVEMISTRTTVGSIGILAHHSPLLAMLDPTELRLYKSDSEVVHFAQAEGYMQIAGNQGLILVEEAYSPSDLDLGDLRDRLTQAEQAEQDADDGSEKQRLAQRDQRRLKAFIRIAEAG